MKLQRLIEAVGRGGELFPSDFPSDFKGKQWAIRAYYGSLDAAKALHDALLPGYKANVNMFNFYASVATPDHESHVVTYDGGSKWYDDVGSIYVATAVCPARAWLLAILKAYQQVQLAT